MPEFVSDVTVFLRFILEEKGLHVKCKTTKNDIMGFFNPIPPFMKEHDYPYLCIVY